MSVKQHHQPVVSWASCIMGPIQVNTLKHYSTDNGENLNISSLIFSHVVHVAMEQTRTGKKKVRTQSKSFAYREKKVTRKKKQQAG